MNRAAGNSLFPCGQLRAIFSAGGPQSFLPAPSSMCLKQRGPIWSTEPEPFPPVTISRTVRRVSTHSRLSSQYEGYGRLQAGTVVRAVSPLAGQPIPKPLALLGTVGRPSGLRELNEHWRRADAYNLLSTSYIVAFEHCKMLITWQRHHHLITDYIRKILWQRRELLVIGNMYERSRR